ncbi:hypothetical protein ACFOET_02280 [Parapedobacter deserti]|uniref:DUF4230 domain-containing protein n=1 Tax=Parapedobacter deserti TaxID=1912957 RepID=A0ABV7JJH5_9SPHI
MSALCAIALFVLASFSSCSSPVKPENFETTVWKVIHAFQDRDTATLNGLISEKIKLAVLYRIGVFDEYVLIDSIDFEQPMPDYLGYPDIVAVPDSVHYTELPVYDCGELVWDKTGLFADTTRSDDKLAQTALNLVKYRGDSIPEAELARFRNLAQQSRRIVLAGHEDEELIFNLTLIADKWYLTLIDRVTTDCSA